MLSTKPSLGVSSRWGPARPACLPRAAPAINKQQTPRSIVARSSFVPEVLKGLGYTPEELNGIEAKLKAAEIPLDDETREAMQQNLQQLRKHKLGVKGLVLREPRLLTIHLPEWFEFLSGYGFTEDQVIHMITTEPKALASATLVTAGNTMLLLKKLGLDEYGIKQMCCYYPQVLYMDAPQVESIVSILSKHQTTHGC